MNKNKFIAVLVLVLVLLVAIVFLTKPKPVAEIPAPVTEAPVIVETVPTSTVKVVGYSVQGREIGAHSFGSGDTNLLFVGGIHGGYEWNSVSLAYEFIDYFDRNFSLIPENITVSIIPNLNPDAVYEVTGVEGRFDPAQVLVDEDALAKARFNTNDVDLNRNFACKWQPESSWRGQAVSAGTAAFSEPEAAALRDYVTEFGPESVIFWHSQANTVYASECEDGVIPKTLEIMETYAAAADYNTQASFDAYEITGDAEGWLASIGIPAITVELENHQDIDWSRNVEGVTALLDYYSTDLAR